MVDQIAANDTLRAHNEGDFRSALHVIRGPKAAR
jgi:hypothetical protein